MVLDLSGVQRTVEGFLGDSLQLWRDTGGESDDVLDEETGALRSTTGAALVWEGKGAVVFSGTPAASASLDGLIAQLPSDTAYHGLLPLGAPQVLVDDLLAVVESARDVLMMGRRFRVAGVASGSFVVVRIVALQFLEQ